MSHSAPPGPPGRLRPAVTAVSTWLRSGRYRLAGSVLVIGLVAAGLIVIVSANLGNEQPAALPPVPPAPATTTHAGSVPSATRGERSAPHSRPATSARAHHQKPAAFECGAAHATGDGDTPAQICIPAIRVTSTVMSLGLNRDRTVEVPPLSRVGEAGWYRYSAAPGTVGPTVILGHVDSAQYGAGVFYRLGQLRAGDTVDVTRNDDMVATFVITDVQEVPKSKFPTDAVYGSTSGPSIRLVTCGGTFDAATGNYLDNIIAYGTLRKLRHA